MESGGPRHRLLRSCIRAYIDRTFIVFNVLQAIYGLFIPEPNDTTSLINTSPIQTMTYASRKCVGASMAIVCPWPTIKIHREHCQIHHHHLRHQLV